MAALIVRIALIALGVAFTVWWLYVTWLGLKSFFKRGKNGEK